MMFHVQIKKKEKKKEKEKAAKLSQLRGKTNEFCLVLTERRVVVTL